MRFDGEFEEVMEDVDMVREKARVVGAFTDPDRCFAPASTGRGKARGMSFIGEGVFEDGIISGSSRSGILGLGGVGICGVVLVRKWKWKWKWKRIHFNIDIHGIIRIWFI